MSRYLSAFRLIRSHPHPLRFVVSRILLRLNVALPVTSIFSHDPLVRISLTANPIAHNSWLTDTEPMEVEVFKKYIASQAIVFDIGSNVGTHALLAAKLAQAGHVYAFEPGENAFAALQKNIDLNKVENITCFNVAVSDRDAQWNLVQPGRSDEQSFLAPANEGAPVIRTVRLDDLMKEHHVSYIDFMKIDVEGAELLVLRSLGDLLTGVHTIFLENLPHAMERFGYTHAELYAFLTQNGFSIHSVAVSDGTVILTPATSLLDASPNILAMRGVQ